jgi:uncharacterized protein (TIGR00369 family)
MIEGRSVGRLEKQQGASAGAGPAHDAQRADAARTRTFQWGDPVAAAERGAALGGLAYLRAIVAGEIPQPPIAEALDMRLTEVEPGRAVFTCDPSEIHYNLIGTVHGGLAATLIDSATGCAVYSALDPGDRWTTLNLSVEYLAGIDQTTGLVTCEARTVRVGRRVGIADAVVRDGSGRVYARGSTTCLLTRK